MPPPDEQPLWIVDADTVCFTRHGVGIGPVQIVAATAVDVAGFPASHGGAHIGRGHAVRVLDDDGTKLILASRARCGYVPNSWYGHHWPDRPSDWDVINCGGCIRHLDQDQAAGRVVRGDEWQAQELWRASCDRGHGKEMDAPCACPK